MRALRLAVALLLGLPAAAHAATVQVAERTEDSVKSGSYQVTQLVVAAAPGEVNDVSVELTPDPVSTEVVTAAVRDARAPLTAGPGCTAVDEHEAHCDAHAYFEGVVVSAGDLDDRVRVPSQRWPLSAVDGGTGSDDLAGPLALRGGDGDDRLTAGAGGWMLDAGPGDDVVAGGTGSDTLAGGGGRDVLRGGPGDDVLSDGDGDVPGTDVVDGGSGTDTVDYRGRRRPIVLALPGRGEGEAGEGDALSRLENAYGGEADDLLVGTGGPTMLEGGGGDDQLTGGGGRDSLSGGPGDDRLDGGPGDDGLSGEAGDDALLAGRGNDGLQGSAGDDHLDAGPGHDELDGGTGEDRLRGRAGDDRLAGGGLADVLDGGRGSDDLRAGGDFFADRVRCGAGGDEAALDRGDRAGGCERRRRTEPRGLERPALVARFGEGPRRGGPSYQVEAGRTEITLNCLDIGIACDARVGATAGGVTVLRARLRCDDDTPDLELGDCEATASGTARLTRAGRRLLRERGRLRARATVLLDPGRARGAIPIRGPIRLRRR